MVANFIEYFLCALFAFAVDKNSVIDRSKYTNLGGQFMAGYVNFIFTDGNSDVSVCGRNLAALNRFMKS